MRIGALLSVLGCMVCVAASGCKGPEVTYSTDASVAGSSGEAGSAGDAGASGASTGSRCDVPKNSNSQPIGTCLSAAKFVDCTFDSGTGVGCLSNGPTSCAGADGATCVDKCASNQFAVSCGGPPLDGGVTYETVPANCEVIATTPGGKSYACCSCDSAK